MTRFALRGHLLDFVDDPAEVGRGALREVEDGMLVIEDGHITVRGEASDLLEPELDIVDHRGALILPGLIDTHIHYPQTRVVGSYGAQLLEWLERYTFPEETRFADPEHAEATADFFLDELLRHGTTTAAVYCTTHPVSAEALFAAAEARNMRLIAGKVMMDRGAPEALLDTPERGFEESRALIERWHARNRLAYAITPRFAVTSSEAQLEAAGVLLRTYPDCYLQTHLAENREEIATVARLFPWSKHYTHIYERFGLLGPRALLGHCIHLAKEERRTLSEAGAVACFCPTSNLFIGSGLFDLAAMRDPAHPVRVSLATDIGGGTSYSMLQTAAEGYKVLQLHNQSWPPLDALHMLTRGNARALGLDHEIGTLDEGTMADLTVLDPAATPAMQHRMQRAETIEERLFALLTMGDDRTVSATYVGGNSLRPSAWCHTNPTHY